MWCRKIRRPSKTKNHTAHHTHNDVRCTTRGMYISMRSFELWNQNILITNIHITHRISVLNPHEHENGIALAVDSGDNLPISGQEVGRAPEGSPKSAVRFWKRLSEMLRLQSFPHFSSPRKSTQLRCVATISMNKERYNVHHKGYVVFYMLFNTVERF